MSSDFSNNNVIIDEKRLNGWTIEHENVFIEWSDKAMCYRWLHSRSYKIYSFRNAWFTIPVIVMSTITGTANFAQDKFPPQYKVMAQMLIGGINIIAGILTTIQQFLKITELNEGHRVSAISWGKFVRNVTVILAKSPLERENTPIELLNRYKEEFDRLMEISPDIEDNVLIKFKEVIYNKEKDDDDGLCDKLLFCIFNCGSSRLPDVKNAEIQTLATIPNPGTPKTPGSRDDSSLDEYAKELKKKYKFKKPEICGEFVSVSENRHPWYKSEKVIATVEPIVVEKKEPSFDYMPHVKQINNKIESFRRIRGRDPLVMEIKNNMTNEIDDEILDHILNTLYHHLNFASNKV